MSDQLSRYRRGLNRPAVIGPGNGLFHGKRHGTALNRGRFDAYTWISTTKRKEVIQCLLPSAVTSLGSPAKLSLRLGIGALSALDQRVQKSGRDGSNPAAPFCWNYVLLELCRCRMRGPGIPGQIRRRCAVETAQGGPTPVTF
jgi:hypothetical protein